MIRGAVSIDGKPVMIGRKAGPSLMERNLPGFVEVVPDDFKPVGDCTRDELLAAADRLMISATMGMRDALSEVERTGPSPVSEELRAKSVRDHDVAVALMDHAETID
jgi:hypothetical protein